VPSAVQHTLSPTLKTAAIDTLGYFEFFQHALFVEEVHKYLSLAATLEEVNDSLVLLKDEGSVFEKQGLWALNPQHIQLRLKNVRRNKRMMRVAKRMGKFIHWFPYVRGVYLSGSLSKSGITSSADDIDFFIITKAERVWAAKFLLIAFKKIFLLGSEKYFCINFLMSETELGLKKKNVYVATEAASLVPLTNPNLLGHFFKANPFIQAQFPNFESPSAGALKPSAGVVERMLEWLIGDYLEKKALSMFTAHVRENKREGGYYLTSQEVSAFFPDSVEDQLLAHLKRKSLKDE
jgi:hypothetical protein